MHSIDLSLYTQTEASAMSRLHLMKSAFQCALDHPILGIGPNSWIYIAESYAGDDTEPHSAYIKLAAESGFIGLSIYIFLISNTVSRLLNQRKAYLSIDNYQQAIFSTILAMTLTGIAIPFIFLNHPYSEFLWAWIAVSWSYLSLQPPTSKTEEHGLSIGNITVLR
jgi:O-antigen ligase